MKTLKLLGCAGIVGVAFVLSSNGLIHAETSPEYGAGVIGMQKVDNNVVHRVNRAIALTQKYSNNESSGYKWGQKSFKDSSEPTAVSAAKSGYKWGSADLAEQAGSKWGRSNTAEQAGSKWGRS